MLYILNLYNVACQLYINKSEFFFKKYFEWMNAENNGNIAMKYEGEFYITQEFYA